MEKVQTAWKACVEIRDPDDVLDALSAKDVEWDCVKDDREAEEAMIWSTSVSKKAFFVESAGGRRHVLFAEDEETLLRELSRVAAT